MSAKQVYFVTGTDTGVGKTVVTAMITRYLRERGESVMAVKPYCSGGRDDARRLRDAMGRTVTLDEINPWHFRASLAPVIAARRKGVLLSKSDCQRFLKKSLRRAEILVIEGAGGLLSPLGEGFDARDLINELDATPIVVCPNRLGAINQVRLVWEALPKSQARCGRIAFVEPRTSNPVSRTNMEFLEQGLGRDVIIQFPQLPRPAQAPSFPMSRRLKAVIEKLVERS